MCVSAWRCVGRVCPLPGATGGQLVCDCDSSSAFSSPRVFVFLLFFVVFVCFRCVFVVFLLCFLCVFVVCSLCFCYVVVLLFVCSLCLCCVFVFSFVCSFVFSLCCSVVVV